MLESDIEIVYKSNLPTSHFAGLRAVYDAGYYDGLNGTTNLSNVSDASGSAPAPTAEPTITTP